MAKVKTRTPIPKHANLKDPSERAFWERWARVGDAKLDVQSATKAIIDAEDAWQKCRRKMTSAQVEAGEPCACGKCPGRYHDARAGRDEARDRVDDAVAEFKAG